jgi:hypothetical protein
MVSQRAHLPSCGHYRAWWGMAPASPSYQPSEKIIAANGCLEAAFNDGRPAELAVISGPDDIGHTWKTFYRVVRRHVLEVISEDIPPSGRIQAAKLSDCTTLTDVGGQIGADACHPAGPAYSP